MRVQRGDTLYGLAFRNEIDFRDLATWNNIGAPYTIYPGQSLRLYPAGGKSASTGATASRPATTFCICSQTPSIACGWRARNSRS